VRHASRTTIAAVLLAAILVLAAFGSLFPQRSRVISAEPQRLEQWEGLVSSRYGDLAASLRTAGAFTFFRSPLFVLLVALLGVVTLTCTRQRWRSVWLRATRQPLVCSTTALDAPPHTATLGAKPGVDHSTRLTQALAERGYRVLVGADGDLTYLRGDRNRLSPLATLVTHLTVLLLLLGAVLTGSLGWQEQLTLARGEAAAIGHNTGLAIRHASTAVTRHPDGSISGYTSEVTLSDGSAEEREGIVRVNAPIVWRGVRVLVSSYEADPGGEGDYAITLLAVHDPGFGLAIAAGLLLLAGITVSFNFPHAWVQARIEPSGGLRLAGRAERQAYGFATEFTSMVEELREGPNR
jgi:cytochrome c biogenesis protein